MESKAALRKIIKVAVRVRPQFIQDDSCCVTCEKNTLEIVNHRNYTQNIKFKFTTVFDADSTQEDVYKTFMAPNLGHVFNGENMSILAYGATGTGKTYTMVGTKINPGIIPQTLRDLFQTIEASTDEKLTYKIKLSVLEIYNEKVIDLLIERRSDLQIREDIHKNIIVHGLTEKEIASYEEFESIFLPAISQRTTIPSNLNNQSSRSHTILTVIVEKTEVFPPFTTYVGKIQCVDLAGSENNKMSGNKGLRMRESSCINKSLFILHEVVDAIKSGRKRIPYRDSKLTRLIQDSFGGRSSAMLIATIAPEERCHFNTYCTLNFATKSKKIVNNPVACQQNRGCESRSSVNNLQQDVAKKRISSSDISVGDASAAVASTASAAAAVASSTTVDLVLARELLKSIQEKTKILKTALEKDNHSEKNTQMTGSRCISSTADISDNISKTTGDCGTPHLYRSSSSKVVFETRKQSYHENQRSDNVLARNDTADNSDNISKTTEDCGTPRLYRGSSSSRVMFDMRKRSFTKNQMSDNVLVRNAGILRNIVNSTPLRPVSILSYKSHSEIKKRRYSEMDIAVGDSSKDDEILIKHRHKTHKNHVLYLLNSQNKADIILLHTVGTRRAELIYNWQQKHGPFQKVEDLYKITDLGEKYVSTFMHRNFLQIEDKENMDSIGINLL